MQFQTTQYQKYLQSPKWAVLREVAIERDGGRCVFCNSSEMLEVHHRTYERKYREQLGDLTTLCGDCHARHHGKVPRSAERRLASYDVEITGDFEAKLDALIDNAPQFAADWTHMRERKSLRSFDAALCSFAAGAMTDDELKQLIITHRQGWDDPTDPLEGHDYIARTIAYARGIERRARLDGLGRRAVA